MKTKFFVLLLIFVSCGPTESEIQEQIEQAVEQATSTTTTTKYVVQNPLLEEESIAPLVPFEGRYSSFECPDAPPPKEELFLVNLSSIPDENLIQCYNYALSKTIPTEIETLLIIYPVGDYVGELQNNDTPYRGAGFEPVLNENEVSTIYERVLEFYGPECNVEQQAYGIARYAEIGGGQQVQAALCPELSNKKTVIITIDPERKKIPIELQFVFFHEIFHALQIHLPYLDDCLLSDSPEDSFALVEGGANYFAWVTTATLQNIPKEQLMGEWLTFIKHIIAVGESTTEFKDPAIAEKAAIGLYLLVQRGDLDEELLLNATIFSTCNGDYFSSEMMTIARQYWYDAEVVNGKVLFSDQALSK
ncbi:hypothetical protein N9M07_01965 [Candidatus Actinomarina sp.]|jgi:hypothetical protein|nr:hypothetical protein [bacterium]MDA8652809.1 hypothetical protein [Candidatus Actinomarina sp.]MDA9017708.1 hypothetical protein [Acidimicrobiia bacterium]MDA8710263.1 hypothetical protein [Candidatus Actinomarina sp.]MDA9209648.1 hypothetical protein [Acidimicrobiia bacterium]|tara:strand:- start:57 stop:1142 length:1086 start_codon:yes stop_codon:yes gene_type:complete